MLTDDDLKAIEQMMTRLLEERGLKTPAALSAAATALRMRRYRERKRNATVTRRNGRRNGVHRENVTQIVTKRNAGVTTPPIPVVVSIPLNDGSEFDVTEPMAGEFEKLYPAVDVPQTLREIRGWNLADPRRRKTRDGIMRHINGWLRKEQNKG